MTDPRNNSIESVERSPTYYDNLNKLGNSVENIKIVNNFVLEEDCKKLLSYTNNINPIVGVSAVDKNMNPTSYNSSFIMPDVNEFNKYKLTIRAVVEKQYNIKIKNRSFGSIVKWDTGSNMDLHSDDIYTLRNDGTGITDRHHMSALIYLNDDYAGGELYFPNHNLLLKPKTGDLVMFPGNIYYPHEVKTVESGSRYTIPIWFEFI
jgi:hypothetical protein